MVLLVLALLVGLLLLLLLLLLRPGIGVMITGCAIWCGVRSGSISCDATTGGGDDGVLRIRRRCLIDMLRTEAALSGRGGIDVDIDDSTLLRYAGSSGRGGRTPEGGGRGAVRLSLNAR